MDQDWLVYHPNPSRPSFRPPPGAVDAHCHVFGPGDVFAYAQERKYTPCDAPAAKLFELRDWLGFERNVIVQATCHGADNRAMVDALQRSQGRARGVATARAGVSDAELLALHAAGVRGLRFNFVKRLADSVPRETLLTLARRIAPSAGTPSSTSRPSSCPSCTTSSLPCLPWWWSITWDART